MKPTAEQYKKIYRAQMPKSKTGVDCLCAFTVGGMICMIGQVFLGLYSGIQGVDKDTAALLTSATLIALSALLTGFGVYDRISSFAGADHFDGRTERHCHFMCTRCERIIDLENEKIHHIMELAGENFGGKITDYSARFFGLCEDCLKETANESDTSHDASDKKFQKS